MRRPLCLGLAGLLLSVGLATSPSSTAPGAAQAVESVPTAAARSRDVLVSRRVPGLNTGPAMAVDPNTGNVLVVWRRLIPPTSEVWASLLRRKNSGRYRKPRARMLASGEGLHFGARVAWIEANQQFFVVWEHNGSEARVPFKRILGRAVNGKTGKPVGGVKTVIADDKYNTTPVITATFANGSQDITLVYTSAPNPFTRYAAPLHFTSIINTRISVELAAQETVELMRMEGDDEIEVQKLLFLTDDCTLILYNVSGDKDGSSFTTAHAKIVAEDGKTDDLDLTLNLEVFSFVTVKGAQENFFDPFGDAPEVDVQVWGEADGSTVMWDLTFSCGFFGPAVEGHVVRFDVQAVIAAVFVNSRSTSAEDRIRVGEIGYFVSAQTDGKVYKQVLDEELNLVGTQELIFNHRDKLTSMIGGPVTLDSSNGAARLGKKANSVLVWTKSVGKDFDQEIWAHVFYLKPLE